MAIEGPLRELALTDVFQLLDLSRKTGLLSVTDEGGGRRAVVRFERGAVTGAELAGSTTRIDQLLLRAGKVTQAQIAEAVRAQRAAPGQRIGAVLVEAGAVSEEDVRRHVAFQIEQIVFELIRWRDGYFRFEEAPPGEPDRVPVRIGTESLLMEAARRIDEWSVLESKVPHMKAVPALVGELADDAMLDLRPAEWEVLAEIDGERPLKTIASELGRSDFEVAKIVFGLVSTGVVEVVDERPAAIPAPAADVPSSAGLSAAQAALREGRWAEAAAALERVVSLDPLSPEAHYHLGFAAARTGALERAEAAWSTFLRLPDADDGKRASAERARAAAAALRAVLDGEAG